MRIRKDAKYIYPALEVAIIRSRKTHKHIAQAIGITDRAWHRKRKGENDWKLGEMLDVRDLLAPDMTLDELFQRKKV